MTNLIDKYLDEAKNKMTLPEFIEYYVGKDWNKKYADQITQDMIDVMTGNRQGNNFENKYSKVIMAEYKKHKK